MSKKPRNAALDIATVSMVVESGRFSGNVTQPPTTPPRENKPVVTLPKIVYRRTISGRYPEPDHVQRCLRVFAASDNHRKGRSKRGWNEPVVISDNLMNFVKNHWMVGFADHETANEFALPRATVTALYTKWAAERKAAKTAPKQVA